MIPGFEQQGEDVIGERRRVNIVYQIEEGDDMLVKLL